MEGGETISLNLTFNAVVDTSVRVRITTAPGTASGKNISIGYTPRARLLSDLATECHRNKVAKSLGNQARGVQPACTMTTQDSKIRLISSIALKPRLITYQPEIEQFDWPVRTSHNTIIAYSHSRVMGKNEQSTVSKNIESWIRMWVREYAQGNALS